MQAVTELLRLAPSTAVLITRDESGRTVAEEEVPTALIQRGDLLKVWPGILPMLAWCSARSVLYATGQARQPSLVQKAERHTRR